MGKWQGLSLCPRHALWTLHKHEECKLAEPKDETHRGNTSENKWRLANTLSVIQAEEEDSVK